MTTRIAFLALLLMGVAAACRAPADGGSSTPAAPAIETDHPDAEQSIPLPESAAPVAPAIETDHPEAEQPVPLPSPSE